MKKAAIVFICLMTGFIAIMIVCITSKTTIDYPEPQSTINDDAYYIDINTATAEQLQIIPGIGEVTANNIIEYRNQNGPFYEYSQLLNVNGIGHQKLVVIMEYARIK